MELRDDYIFARSPVPLATRILSSAMAFFVYVSARMFSAEQGIVGFKQVPDAFGDDARLACASAGDDQQRPVTMRDGAALRVVEEQACAFRLPHFKRVLAIASAG